MRRNLLYFLYLQWVFHKQTYFYQNMSFKYFNNENSVYLMGFLIQNVFSHGFAYDIVGIQIEYMIKINGDKNRYFPISHNSRQVKIEQRRMLKTEYLTFTMEEEFKSITYTIRNKSTPEQRTIENSLLIPKHLFQSQKKHDGMIKSKVRQSKRSNADRKMSEFVKQPKPNKKRYSCHDVDKSFSRHNWMQNILRRKNNGSYGHIVRGLTSLKHDSLLQKFQAVSSYRQGINQNPLEIEYTQKFIPLGVSNLASQPTTRKNVSQLKGKKKMNLYKKKPKLNPSNYFEKNIKIKSQRNERISKTSFQSSIQLRPNEKARIIKKLTQPYKIQRVNLGPWDDAL